MTLVRLEITIDASASVVYEHLTEREGLLRWIAVDARADARPGGELSWTHENGATMSGRFIELSPPERLVFTYGWVDDLMGVPPGSTVVEIDLAEDRGRTTLTLVHRELPDDSTDAHKQGWMHFLDVLGERLAHAARARFSGGRRAEV